MVMFSAATIALLQRAGWRDDRQVDTSEYEKRLKSEGYPFHAVVLDFLERFGGLLVVHPHHRVPQTNDEFYLNPACSQPVAFDTNRLAHHRLLCSQRMV